MSHGYDVICFLAEEDKLVMMAAVGVTVESECKCNCNQHDRRQRLEHILFAEELKTTRNVQPAAPSLV
jgi:hypothetical protein